MKISRAAGAKINVFLDVVKRRQDGYHEIVTVFLPVSPPSDCLCLSTGAPGVRLQIRGCPVSDGPDNLVVRAAMAFSRHSGIPAAWNLLLTKEIPVSAGLGGGSSDAAATLLALNDACGRPLSETALHEMAVTLGADVPFFLHPRPALGEGIGERLRPIQLGRSLDIILLNAGFPSPVRQAYRMCTPTGGTMSSAKLPDLLSALRDGDVERIAGCSFNALEIGLRRKFPILDMQIEYLLSHGCLGVQVSGSGPTVYGFGEPKNLVSACAQATEVFGDGIWSMMGTVAATE